MGVRENAALLMDKVFESVESIEEERIEEMLQALQGAKRIFVVGAGRSGLVARAFAMRLMHLGFPVYVVGETITPAMDPEDVLVALSGSGRTSSVVNVAKIAKEKIGAKVVAVTSKEDSPLAKLSDVVVIVGGRENGKKRDYIADQLLGKGIPITPLGTLFEVSAMILLDSLVVELMRRMKKSEEELRKRHANLE